MKRINIQNPHRLVNFVERSLTGWKITYIGKSTETLSYYYNLTHKENVGVMVSVEIYNETQRMYDTKNGPTEDWVKIYCKDVNVPQKRGCTKFLRVEDFKDMRRVLNVINDGGRQVLS